MDEKQEKNKRKFISEKIVGRELTLRHAVKYAVLAVICGVLFGVSAAIVFSCARGTSILQMAEAGTQREQEKNADNALETDEGGSASDGSQAVLQETESAEDSRDLPEEEVHAGSGTEPAEAENPGEAQKPQETDEEYPADVEALVRNEVERYSFTDRDLQSMFSRMKEGIREADRHIVSVQAVRRDTGWFNDTIETAQQASGIIVAIRTGEIQILTTEEAVQSADSLTVTFRDGTVEDAVLRQTSHLDGIALLAVSKERLGTEFLSSISAVPFGGFRDEKVGEAVYALGSPLGVTHSADMGWIGYVMHDEQTADGSMDVIYTNIASNAAKGTFLLSLDGTLLGMARPDGADTAVSSYPGMMNAAYIRSVLSCLAEGKAVPYIGIVGRSVSSEMTGEGLPAGVYVSSVKSDSPAYETGIKNGDIVIAIGDTEINDMDAYQSAVGELSAGGTVTLRVMRSSGNNEYRELSFQLTVGSR